MSSRQHLLWQAPCAPLYHVCSAVPIRKCTEPQSPARAPTPGCCDALATVSSRKRVMYRLRQQRRKRQDIHNAKHICQACASTQLPTFCHFVQDTHFTTRHNNCSSHTMSGAVNMTCLGCVHLTHNGWRFRHLLPRPGKTHHKPQNHKSLQNLQLRQSAVVRGLRLIIGSTHSWQQGGCVVLHADQVVELAMWCTQYGNSGNAGDTKRLATCDSPHCGGDVHTVLHLATQATTNRSIRETTLTSRRITSMHTGHPAVGSLPMPTHGLSSAADCTSSPMHNPAS